MEDPVVEQRLEVLNELAMVGFVVEFPFDITRISSRQFAEVVAGAVGRKIKRSSK